MYFLLKNVKIKEIIIRGGVSVLMGLLIGIPAGILHVFLLSEFTGGLVKTGKPPLLFGLGVALLPPLVLIPVALLWREVIAWVGIGMAVVSFVPYPRVRLRSHSRRFFRIAGIGITLVSLMLLFA